MRQVELENQLENIRKERDDLQQRYVKVENDYSTIRRDLASKEENSKKRQSLLEARIKELEAASTSSINSTNSNTSAGTVGVPIFSILCDFTNFLLFLNFVYFHEIFEI